MNRYLLVSITVIISLWYIASCLAPQHILPYPHDILYALINLILYKNLLVNIGWTLLRVFIGFSLGVLLGLGLGVLVILYSFLRDIVYPFITLIVVTPSFAFIPLLMIWIGLNDLLAITAVIICTCFPITLSLLSAVKSIDPDLVDVARSLGADNRVLIRKVILPLALTHIASILKLEAGHSWRIVFVTEFLALSTGLGALMMNSYSILRVDEVIALVIVVGLLALVFQYIIEYIESTIMKKWGFME